MQMQLCLEVTERAWCDFISWSPGGYVIYRVRHDPQLHGKMLPHYIKFFSAMQRMAPAPPPLSADEKTLLYCNTHALRPVWAAPNPLMALTAVDTTNSQPFSRYHNGRTSDSPPSALVRRRPPRGMNEGEVTGHQTVKVGLPQSEYLIEIAPSISIK